MKCEALNTHMRGLRRDSMYVCTIVDTKVNEPFVLEDPKNTSKTIALAIVGRWSLFDSEATRLLGS